MPIFGCKFKHSCRRKTTAGLLDSGSLIIIVNFNFSFENG